MSEVHKEEVEHKLNMKEPSVVRMRVPEGSTTFSDAIRGPITIQNEQIDDQIL